MSTRILPAVAGLLLLASATQAGAATRSIDLSGIEFVPNSGSVTAFGVLLPNASSPDFQFGFTLPQGYKTNTKLKVVLRLNVDASSCSVNITPTAVVRLRTGKEFHNTFPNLNGMAASIVAVPAGSSPVVSAAFNLTKPASGPFTDQRAGDRIILTMTRPTSDPSDTCAGNVTVFAAKIIYTVK